MKMNTKELKRVCMSCGRKYAHGSHGYNFTEKCICGSILKNQLVVQDGQRYSN